MLRFAVVILFSIALSNCGGESAYVAEKVKYRVFFKEMATQVSFVLAPTYQIKTNTSSSFTNRGLFFIRWDEKNSLSEVGTKVLSAPRTLKDRAGATLIKNLPGDRELPSTVPQNEIYIVSNIKDSLASHLLFNDKKDLVIGGGITHPQFSKLPKGFFATQKFYSSNRDVEATISILGPSENFVGGVFFFGNFGANPFTDIGPNIALSKKDFPKWDSLDLTAKAPMTITTVGDINSNILDHFRIDDFMDELNDELQKIESTDSVVQESHDL